MGIGRSLGEMHSNLNQGGISEDGKKFIDLSSCIQQGFVMD